MYYYTEPPENVHVSDINPNQLTIDWSLPRLSHNGPIVTYNIASSDCVTCPNATTSTSIKCTNLTIEADGQACSIVIQTIVCKSSSEHNHGATSLTIKLKGQAG